VHAPLGDRGLQAQRTALRGARLLSPTSRFPSHRVDGPKVYTEVAGIDFEDFEVGLVFEHRPGRTLTALEGSLHALRSLDLGPRHVDRHYSARAHGGEQVIAETFVLALVTALTTKTFGKVAANLGWTDVRFPRPVHPGDTVYAESEILGTRDSRSRPTQGLMHVRTRAVNQHGEEVCAFERRFLIYKRGHGPYRDAGY
jgi:itaconyl-CoA hydratase